MNDNFNWTPSSHYRSNLKVFMLYQILRNDSYKAKGQIMCFILNNHNNYSRYVLGLIISVMVDVLLFPLR